jgi:GntR family transcriptional regulator
MALETGYCSPGQCHSKGTAKIGAKGDAERYLNASAGSGPSRSRRGDLLEIEVGDPLLTMTRVVYDTGGRSTEYGYHCYPAKSYSFEMVLAEL